MTTKSTKGFVPFVASFVPWCLTFFFQMPGKDM